MPLKRNIFLYGLRLTLRRLPALLWTYVFNLGLALVFSLTLYHRLNSVMSHSLAAQRLVGGFDIGTATEAALRLNEGPAGGAAANYSGVPLFLLLYLILIPGTLFCYITKTPARLSTLLHQGLLHFWRFVRITILTLFVSACVLGPLIFLQGKWADFLDNHIVGRTAFLLNLAAYILLFLVASILRLYFDLVEVYTVQLGLHMRPPAFGRARPDRRVRRTLGPAWRTLREHFPQVWPVFLFLTIIGVSAVVLSARTAIHMLAQPRVWPMFLLAQFGLFLMLFTRFWQRGSEISVALQNPIFTSSQPPILPVDAMVAPTDPLRPKHPAPIKFPLAPTYTPPAPSPVPDLVLPDPVPPNPVHTHTIPDPIPDPEPVSPSLDEPDPGVFHHDPVKPPIKPPDEPPA